MGELIVWLVAALVTMWTYNDLATHLWQIPTVNYWQALEMTLLLGITRLLALVDSLE
jgi:hypothetical protein